MKIREISRIVTCNTQYDGAGAKLARVVGQMAVTDFDPFLMLDAFDYFDSDDYIKEFPWCSHRGTEPITYDVYCCIRNYGNH